MEEKKKSWTKEMLSFYLQHRFSAKTEDKVQQWLVDNYDNEESVGADKDFWNSIKSNKNADTTDALKRVNARIGVETIGLKKRWITTFSKVAAVLALLVGIASVWFYLQHKTPEMIEITAQLGETKQLILPDSSEVWLNAGSTLEYPAEFGNKTRPVHLTGEAFFSVTKNKTKPFIVQTEHLAVKVLGTKFNVQAYSGDLQTTATLQEGKIEVQTNNNQKQQLAPNEQLVLNNATSVMNVLEIDPEDIPDWKNGNLIFSDASLGEILQTVKRKFNVVINIDKSIDLTEERYSLKFQNNESAEEILRVLADVAGDFSFSEENGQMILKKHE